MKQRFDPITLEILWRRMISVVDEADASVARTAFSSLLRDAHDYCTAFFDRKGREICQGTFVTPGQIGAMALGVKKICNMFPQESYKPGDVLVTNDPWLLAGHLNDVAVLSPIFFKAKLVGFAACVFHHSDIGGRAAPDDREVYEDGLFIPVVKLYGEGVLNQALFDLMHHNVRMPDDFIGDLRSQVAANHVCSQKIIAMMADAGLDSLDDLSNEIIQRTERSMRQAIEKIPDGVYYYEEPIEQAGGREDARIKVAVEVKGSHVEIDFDGSSPQVDWAVNSVYNFTYAYSLMAIKCAYNPEIPNNEGCSLPVKVKAPEGSLVNCRFPAPVAARTHIGHSITNIIFKALAPATPKQVLADCGGAPAWTVLFYGRRHNGEKFLNVSIRGGGLGASHLNDGLYCALFPANGAHTPCEILESGTPLIIERMGLVTDSGGPGKTRGQVGYETIFRVPDDEFAPIPPVVLNLFGSRFRHASKGLFNDKESCKAKFLVNGEPRDWGKVVFLQPGDTVHLLNAGGGGYGNPLERDPEKVESDVINGYVSLDKAREDYGVVINPKTMKLELEATKKLRQSPVPSHHPSTKSRDR